MSALTRFQPKLTTGHLRYHIDDEKVIDGYLECDGSVVLKNSYPALSEVLGARKDSNNANGVLQTSGTIADINALVYGNNTFVYGDVGGAFASSSDAVTWTTPTNPTPAIAYVGGKTFARVGTTSTTPLTLTDLTGGTNAAPQSGDLVVIAVATGSTALRSQAVTGYTQISTLYANDIRDTNLWVGYKVMGETPDTAVTIPSTGSIDDAQTVAIQVWRNASFANATTLTGTDTILVDPPSITTTSINNMLLVIGAGGHDHGTETFSAGYLSNFLTIGSNDTHDSSIGFGSIAQPTPGTYDPAAWTWSGPDSSVYSHAAVTIALTSGSINTLLYANNTFVFAGDSGNLSTSSNAVTWTIRTSGTSNNINALAYGNNTFVFAGDSGNLSTSSNAVSWTSRTSGTSNNINALAYGNNTFVYGGQAVIASSPDSITWTRKNVPSILYVGGRTYAQVANTGTQTVNLTTLTGGLAAQPSAGDLVIVAVALASFTTSFTAGANDSNDQAYTTIADVVSSDTNVTRLYVGFKVMGDTPDTTVKIVDSVSSADPDATVTVAIQVWRNANYSTFSSISQINTSIPDPPAITTPSSNNVVLAIGAGAHDDGLDTFSSSTLSNFLTIGYNLGKDSTIGFGSIERPIVGSYNPPAFTFSGTSGTADSAAAVTVVLEPKYNVRSMIYANNTFVLVGDAGVLATSTDGNNWTLGTSNTTQDITTITYDDIENKFAFATSSGQILYGTPESWTSINSGTSNSINSIIYNEGFLLYAGDSGIIGTSSNYTYDPNVEFVLPTSNNIFNEINTGSFTPTAFIKI